MPITAEQYFQNEVLKSASAAKKAIKIVTGMPTSLIKQEMQRTFDIALKSKYPITHALLTKSLNGGGTLKWAETSKVAAAVLGSAELKCLAQKNRNSCFKTQVIFRSNSDLARSFQESTLIGDIKENCKKFVIKGTLIDTFDFRFSLIPKNLTVRGTQLRLAGNIAFVAQEMRLLKPVKISVRLAGTIKL